MLNRPLRPDARLLPLRPSSRTPAGLADTRLLTLTRAACAAQAPLRRPFLRGRWHAAHLHRVATAVARLAAADGEIDPSQASEVSRQVADRLEQLIGNAPTVADGLNSLAEFLGGRAPSHPDRLSLVRRLDRPPDEATPPDAA